MNTTILVIDDSEDDQRLYQRAFKDFGASFDLIMASSAEAGFARLTDVSPGSKRPDLILLDYNLPDMDGLSFMRKLAGYSATPTPIIMLSGEGNAAVAVEAMKNGVDDYIVKDTEGQYLRLLPGVIGHVMAAHAQREHTQRLQQETEALLLRNQILMESSMDGIRVLDLQGNVVEANGAFCRLLGYTHEEVLRLNVADWDAQWSAEELRERLKEQVGKTALFETVHRRKDGGLIDVEVSTSGMEIDGQYFIFASSRDTTERKRAEANMRAMLDNSPYLNWLKDAEGRYIAGNKVFTDYLRLEDTDQIIGKTDLDFWTTELAEKYRADDAEVMATRQQKHIEEQTLDGDKLRWVETYKAPIIDALGNVLGTVGVAKDITERKKAEEEMRLENETGRKRAKELAQQFGHLLKSSFNEIYLIDAHSLHFLQVSEGARRNLGYSADELGKLTPLDLKPSYTRQSFEELIAPLRRGEQHSLLFDSYHRRKDGTLYPVEIRLQLMEAESPVFLAIVQDITERKNAEQDNKKLTRALKLLSECGTLMIHAKNEQLLLEETCLLAVATGGYMMAWVGIAENDEAKTVRPIALSGYEGGYLDNITVTWSDTKFGQGPTGTAIRTGTTVVNQNCRTNPIMAPWRDALIKHGYQSNIALPLVSNNHVFGALTIYSSDPHAFSEEETALLEELANNFSFGIETLRTRDAQKRAEQEAHELSAHLQTVREEEKASFAREIHDELGGTLAALKMDAYWLAGKLGGKAEMRPQYECAKAMIGLLDTAVLATRRIITDLRPTLLDDLGLLEALKWQAAQFQKRTGIECQIICIGHEGCEEKLGGALPINLFRICQEALTNVARHSSATRVTVNLERNDEDVTLSISDNGRGLPEGHTIAPTSYGIRGMRERVTQLGGRIYFHSMSEGGFTVMVMVPVPAALKGMTNPHA